MAVPAARRQPPIAPRAGRTGLHMTDVEMLVDLPDRLVAAGNTVIVIEHDLDVVKRSGCIIDSGPYAGRQGGEVVYAGPPAGLLRSTRSLPAVHLRRDLAAASASPRRTAGK